MAGAAGVCIPCLLYTSNIHVGFPIYEDYQKRRPTVWAADNYFRLLFFLPAILSFLLSGLCGNILWMPLLYLPCYEILRPLTERLAMRKSEVSYPPRLDFQGRIPDDAKTLVTLSVLLPLKTGKMCIRDRNYPQREAGRGTKDFHSYHGGCRCVENMRPVWRRRACPGGRMPD